MIKGVDFNRQLVTAENMGHFIYMFSQKKSGISKGCRISYSGSNIYVQAGYIFACGRMTQIVGTETITVPEVTSGTDYCRLVYEVDLSKVNTDNDFQQGYFRILENYSAYPSLTQQNLDDHPTDGVYQVPFAKFTVTTSGISNWVDERQQFEVMLSGTLQAGQTTLVISDPSITANSMFDLYVETLADGTPVYPEKQLAAAGSLTLTFDAQAVNIGVKVRVH